MLRPNSGTVSCVALYLHFVAIVIGYIAPGGLAAASDLPRPVAERLSDPALKQAIMGSLLYLDDTQIRQREGRGDPRYDACSGDGCRRVLPGTHAAFPLPLPFVQNRAGEWANFIHIFPAGHLPWQPAGEALVQLQDANLFMTATTVYPLYLFDEVNLSEERQVVREMRGRAVDGIKAYRRGDAFSFWPQLPGSSSQASRVGPVNIPMAFAHGEYLSRLLPGLPRRSENPRHEEWFRDLFDRSLNPAGVDAMANIPNDADDTALAISTLQLHAIFDGGEPLDSAPLQQILSWRDVGRAIEDGRDQWKTASSGGFLTWLKDENLSPSMRYATPETGVIPLGVNNVDCIVNANALAALGFAGESANPVVETVSALMARAAEMRAWPECGLYYPQRMMFPYALTRAFRDAGIRNQTMRYAMRRILFDLLRDQQEVAMMDPRRRGAFSGGVDVTFDLSTALALTALLNIGVDVAREAQAETQYHQAIADAVDYLLHSQSAERIRFADTFNREHDYPNFPGRTDLARTWSSGVFFSASKWSLAQWRSQAYTTSMVLEALTKYVLGRDLDEATLAEGSRLRVSAYARNAERAADDFMIDATSN